MVSTFANTSALLTLTTGYSLGLAPGSNRVVTDIEGWTKGAAVRREKIERLNAHGSFSVRGWKDERLVSVSGALFASSRSEAAAFVDEVNAFIADGTAGELAVDDADHGLRRAGVYLLEPEVTWNGGKDVQFTLDMVAPDPRKYGDVAAASTGGPEDGGGLVYDLGTSVDAPGVLDYGLPGSTGIVEVFNAGTAEALPRAFRVAGYTPGFTVTELGTGRRLVYVGTVPFGSELVMNPADGTVRLDGSDRGQLLTVRQWVATPAGGSARYLFEPNGSNALLTVEGVSAWW